MTWVKLDDQILAHPKIVRAGRDARDLFIAGLCYCSSQLTDGVIPSEALRMLGALADVVDPQAAVQRLLEVGLWEQAGDTYDTYHVHDYLDYQPTRERAEVIRQARQEAGSKGGKRSVEAKAQAKRQANASTLAQAKFKQNSTPYPSPSPINITAQQDTSNGYAPDAIEDASPQGADAHSQPRPPVPSQPRNEWWDALVAIFDYEPRTPAERSRWGRAVKDIRAAQATGADLHRAKTHYDAAVASGAINWTLTPNALASHLGELLSDPASSFKPGGNGHANQRISTHGRGGVAVHAATASTPGNPYDQRTQRDDWFAWEVHHGQSGGL